MDQEQASELEKSFQPLKEELGEILKSVVVYGSAARKSRVEGSDIDLAIIVDDTDEKFKPIHYKTAEKILNDIEKDSDYDLHIQPPKLLTQWWELLLEGEPWTVTAMTDAQALYDPDNLITTVKKLLNEEGRIEGHKTRAAKMLDRSKEKREEGLEKIETSAESIRETTLEAVNKLFISQGMSPPSSPVEEVKEEFMEDRDIIDEKDLENFKKVYRSEIMGESYGEYSKTFRSSMKALERFTVVFKHLQNQEKKWVIEEAYQEARKSSEKALEDQGIEYDQPLEKFKEEFVSEGGLDEEYGELLDNLREFKSDIEDESVEDLDEDEVHSASAKIRDLKSAINSVTGLNIEKENIEASDDSSSPYKALAEFQESFRSEDILKASWILSIEDFSHTEEATVILLVDRTKGDFDQFEQRVENARETVREDHGFKVHTEFFDLPDYWEDLRTGSSDIFSEMRAAKVLYDPEGLFLPVKKVIEKGRLEGTREEVRQFLIEAPSDVLQERNKLRSELLNKMYNATVEAAQAALLSEGVSPPVQKKTPEKVGEKLVPEKLSKDVKLSIEFNVRLWKDYEHGEKELKPEEVQKAVENATDVIEAVEQILEE